MDELLAYQRELRRRNEEVEDAQWGLLLAHWQGLWAAGGPAANRTKALEARLQVVERERAAAVSRAEALRVELEEREKALVSFGCRLAEANGKSQQAVSQHSSSLAEALRRVADAEAQVSLLERRRASAEAKHNSLQGEHDALRERYRSLSLSQGNAARAKDALGGKVEDLSRQVAQLLEENRLLANAVQANASPVRRQPPSPDTTVEELLQALPDKEEDAALCGRAPRSDFHGYDVEAALETQRLLTSAAQDEVAMLNDELVQLRVRYDDVCHERERWRGEATEAKESAEGLGRQAMDAEEEAGRAVADAEAASQAAKRAERNAHQLDAHIAQLEGMLRGVEEAFMSTSESASAKDVVINYLAETLDGKDADRSQQVSKYKTMLETMQQQISTYEAQVRANDADRHRVEALLETSRETIETLQKEVALKEGLLQQAPKTPAQTQTMSRRSSPSHGSRASPSPAPSHIDPETEMVLVASKQTIEALHQENRDLRDMLSSQPAAIDPEVERVMIASRETIESLQAETVSLKQRLKAAGEAHVVQAQTPKTKAESDLAGILSGATAGAMKTLQAENGALLAKAAHAEGRAAALQDEVHMQADLMQASKETIEALQADVIHLCSELTHRDGTEAARRVDDDVRYSVMEELRAENARLANEHMRIAEERVLEERVMHDSKDIIEALQLEVTQLRNVCAQEGDAANAARRAADAAQQDQRRAKDELDSCAIYETRCNELESELSGLRKRCQGLENDVRELSEGLALAKAEVASVGRLSHLQEDHAALLRKAAALERAAADSERQQADLSRQLDESRQEAAALSLNQKNEWHMQEGRYQHEAQRCSQLQKRCSALELELRERDDANRDTTGQVTYLQGLLQSREAELSDKLAHEAQRTASLQSKCQQVEADNRSLAERLEDVLREVGVKQTLDQSRSDDLGDKCRYEAQRAVNLERKYNELQKAHRAAEDELRDLRVELRMSKPVPDTRHDEAERARGAERKAVALERDVLELTEVLRSAQRKVEEAQRAGAASEQKASNMEQTVRSLKQSLAQAQDELFAAQEKLRGPRLTDDAARMWEARCHRLEQELYESRSGGDANDVARLRRLNSDLQDDLNRLRVQHCQVKSEKAELQQSVQRSDGRLAVAPYYPPQQRASERTSGAGTPVLTLRPTPAPSSPMPERSSPVLTLP